MERIKNDLDASRSSRSMSCGKKSRDSSHTKNDEFTVNKLKLGGVQRKVLQISPAIAENRSREIEKLYLDQKGPNTNKKKRSESWSQSMTWTL